MHMGYPVFLHFLRRVFDVTTGTTTTSRKSDDFGILVFIRRKSSFAAGERTKAFAPGTGMVAVADKDSNSDLFHGVWVRRNEYWGCGMLNV